MRSVKSEKEIKFSDAIKTRNIKTKLMALMLIVSLVVVPSVFWSLKLTGITMAGEAFCGIEEHIHTNECTERVLVCPLSEDEPGIITEIETQDSKEEFTLVGTTQYESEISEGITPQQTTTEKQTRTETTRKTHTHLSDCYETIYTCNLSEHIHDKTCYANNTADTETQKDWEKTLEKAEITGNVYKDIVAIAETQIGYKESELNFILAEDGTRRGYTRYGEWYGAPYAEWSATFLSFCLSYAGIEDDVAPYSAGTQTMLTQWTEKGIFNEKDSYTPQPGDAVFIKENGSESVEGEAPICDSVGIISNITDDEYTVICGGDKEVKKVQLSVEDEDILGFGSLFAAVKRSLSADDVARIDNTVKRIAELPTYEEIASEGAALDPDSDEYNEWYQNLYLEVLTVYAYYEDLGPTLRLFVADTQKLDMLSGIWQNSPAPLDVVSSVRIYQSNQYSAAVATIAYNGSIRSVMGTGMSYTYWDAVIVDKNSSGYYVSRISTADVSKLDFAPSTSGGFVILIYNNSSALTNVEVGNTVTASPADFYTGKAYSASGIGTITFSTVPPPPEDNSDKLTVLQGADTRDLIEVNLYDYSANINTLYNSSGHIYPGFQQDGGTKSIGTSIGKFSMNFGNNITKDLGTLISNVTTNSPGAINKTVDGANGSLQGAMYPTLQNGYPALNDGKSLDYLFKTNTYATKVNSQSVNGLFLYNDVTGEYTFNSRENHAQYNSSNDTFTLYEEIITSNFIMYPFGNFLPFNDIVNQTTQTTEIDGAWFTNVASSSQTKYNNGAGSEYSTLNTVLTKFVSLMNTEYGTDNWDYRTAINKYFGLNGLTFSQTDEYLSGVYSIDYDEPTDFFFGMDMHMNFIQPEGGLTGKDGKQEMVYEFTGDDDVWVYIDGKLFLDFSGIHRHVGGRIDFVRGVVEYCNLDPVTGDITATPVRTKTFAEILGTTEGLNEAGAFADYTTHTMDFYYMERGAGSGVCRMNFNMPLIHSNNISVSKKLTSDDELVKIIGNPDFSFQVLKENGQDLFIGAGVKYSIYDANGNRVGEGVTDSKGIFKIKAGQIATFGNIFDDGEDTYFVRELLDSEIFEQYGEIIVDGNVSVDDSIEHIVIDGENFRGVDAPVKNVEEGSSSFSFVNHIDTDKLGSLKIKKTFLEESGGNFDFQIKLDGEFLPVGTKYTITDFDGNEREETVTTAGAVTIASGEILFIPNILAGTEFDVRELGVNGDYYSVFYKGRAISVVNDAAIGRIETETPVFLSVINTKKGTYVEFPFKKILEDPDNAKHSYNFEAVQVTSKNGTIEVENGISQAVTLKITEIADGSIFIPFAAADMTAGEKTFFFRVSEVKNDADYDTVYDEDFFVYEVKVVKDNSQNVTAEILSIYKDGIYKVAEEEVGFNNGNVRLLKIKKRVDGSQIEDNKAFRIALLLSHNDEPLNGTYKITNGNTISSVTITDGVGEIYVKHGETVTIYNLPYNTHWTASETVGEEYFPSYQVDSGEVITGSTVQGNLEKDTELLFINSTGFILPDTGDTAFLLYTLGAAIIFIVPLVYGLMLRGKRRKTER